MTQKDFDVLAESRERCLYFSSEARKWLKAQLNQIFSGTVNASQILVDDIEYHGVRMLGVAWQCPIVDSMNYTGYAKRMSEAFLQSVADERGFLHGTDSRRLYQPKKRTVIQFVSDTIGRTNYRGINEKEVLDRLDRDTRTYREKAQEKIDGGDIFNPFIDLPHLNRHMNTQAIGLWGGPGTGWDYHFSINYHEADLAAETKKLLDTYPDPPHFIAMESRTLEKYKTIDLQQIGTQTIQVLES